MKSQIQASARAGIGTEYTEATKQAYQLWKQMNDENPDLAAAYFGDYDQGFEIFDQFQATSPQVAYREAFGFGRIGKGRLYGKDREAFDETFNDVIEDRSGGIMPWNWGGYTLNDQGAKALRGVIYNGVAGRSATSNRPTADLVRQGYQAAVREGRFEQYGVFGWANGKGTQPLSQKLGLQGDDAHKVVQTRILQQLRKIGVEDLERVDVLRTRTGLVITYMDEDGGSKTTTLGYSDLQVAARNYVTNKRKGNRRSATPTNMRRNGL